MLLGLSDPPLPKALSDFHLVLWKFILIHFTLVDLENKPFHQNVVWTGAVRRYASKVNALTFKAGEIRRKAEAQSTTPNYKNLNKLIQPLAHVNDDGEITWRRDFEYHVLAVGGGSGGR